MAAPFKKGLDCFQFDVNFFADDRIEALSCEFGVLGELAAVKLLCSIYRNGYFIEWSEVQKRKLTKSLAGIDLKMLESIAEQMVEYGLFDKSMFEKYCILTSVEIQESYLLATRRRKNIQMEYSLINVNNNKVKEDKCKHNVDINRVNVDTNPDNVCNNSVNDGNNPSDTILPEIEAPNKVLAHEECITNISVIDNSDNLELFNNPSVSNNIITQEKRKLTKKKEAALVFPFWSDEFRKVWRVLIAQPKWKSKSDHALQLSLNKLGKYPEEFAIYLIEQAIEYGWQGVVYESTPNKFREWSASKDGIPIPNHKGSRAKKDVFAANMDNTRIAMQMIDEQYGTGTNNKCKKVSESKQL